jgi:hypothetical protein
MWGIAGAIVILAGAVCFAAGLLVQQRDRQEAGYYAAAVLFIVGLVVMALGSITRPPSSKSRSGTGETSPGG